jgi:hypothetical protein
LQVRLIYCREDKSRVSRNSDIRKNEFIIEHQDPMDFQRGVEEGRLGVVTLRP